MLKSPVARLAVRALLVGLGGFLGAVVQGLPGVSVDELITAANVGYTAALTFIGIGVFTPLEPSIGNKGD